MPEPPLWTPDAARADATAMRAFRARVAARHGVAPDRDSVHRWSVAEPAAFWREIWDACGVVGDGPGEPALEDGHRMPGARWFPAARLSYAENLLAAPDGDLAVVALEEDGRRRALSFGALRAEVAALAAALVEAGVGPGDRVAGVLPNVPAALAAMLAASAVGAAWSSCSPDFGVEAVVDRLGQVAPRVLFVADGYRWKGRAVETLGRARAVAARLPAVERVVVVPVLGAETGGETSYGELVHRHAGAPLRCRRLPFDHPLFVLFSSGTTGPPKCIVHGQGGTLLQHAKEHRLHGDLRAGDRLLYYTTCGWMMWNWQATALAAGATVVLYDGAPTHPRPAALFDAAAAEGVTHLGVSARLLDALAAEGERPGEGRDLSALRCLLSTGSPLTPARFRWTYEAVKADLHLASISGGTDIVSCFVLGDPTAPVRAGEIQGPGLGMAVDVLDDAGRPLREGRGELVCARPFPSMPLGFLGDPDGARYRAAYFERFPGVWHHGDLAEWTLGGGIVVHGRSDSVLNPGGVRIGTAEIYRALDDVEEVAEACAVGREADGDVRVVLLLVLSAGAVLDDALEARLRRAIRERASPRHVPAVIAAVGDLPRTRSGKLSEAAAREALNGRPVPQAGALANPGSLDAIARVVEGGG